MIIDFHVHCFPDNLAKKTVQVLAEKANIEEKSDGTVRQLQKSMKKAGIDYSVIQPIATKPSQTRKINNWAASINKDKIISFATLHPLFENWKKELARIKENSFSGIKFHPDYQNFKVDDENLYPIYEEIFKNDLTILFHCGEDIGLAPPYNCTPDRLENVINAFPGGRIVAAHMGGFRYWKEVEEKIAGKNIYLDTSYSRQYMAKEQFLRIINKHGHDKILFATDSPWKDQQNAVQRIKKLKLEKNIEDAIFYKNAVKLLNLKEN